MPAEQDLIEATAALYTHTAPKRSSALFGAGGLTLRADPLRLDPAPTAAGRDPIERK